ncbi:tetratricopeptide repeat protein [Candidatus Sumerlaeota bacterium]|nr:tetratricopeptide repeat protein [Candidatus Sumerlaeota bacterium]
MKSRRTGLIVSAVLAALILAAYEPVRHNDFVRYDDEHYITQNLQVQQGLTWENVQWAFTSRNRTANWHPLTWLSHMTDIELFGLNPQGHHFHNVALHAVSVILLFWLLWRLTGSIGLGAFTAAVFGLHPLHVESVAWAAERKDVLSALLFILTLAAYAYYAKKGGGVRYALVVLCFALGLMAKPMLVTLPIVLLLLDVWPLKRIPALSGEAAKGEVDSSIAKKSTGGSKKPAENSAAIVRGLIVEKLPLFLLTLISCVVTFKVQQTAGAMQFQAPLSVRLANIPLNYLSYLSSLFWPVDLAVLYPYLFDRPWWQPLGALAVLLGITGFFMYQIRTRPWLIVGWLWFGVMLFPVIGLVQVGVQSTADRYMYLPCIGIAMMLSMTIAELTARWPYRKAILGFAGGLLVLGMVLTARVQTTYWKDTVTLFEHALAAVPDNYAVHNTLGVYYCKDQAVDLDKAAEHFQRTIEIQPDFPNPYVGLAFVYNKQDREEDAVRELQHALKIEPGHPYACNNLANILMNRGELDEAESYLRKALKSEPYNIVANMNMFTICMQRSRAEEATSYMQRVLELDPDYAPALKNLARNYESRQMIAEAIAAYERLVQVEPDNAEALNSLGVLKGNQGLFDEAIECFRKSLKYDPDGVEVCNNLGITLKRLERFQEAVPYFRKARKVAPDDIQCFWNLAYCLHMSGEYGEAVAGYRQILQSNPQFMPVLCNLSWILATSPDSDLRNPTEAVALGLKAAELSKFGNPAVLNALAAAYAAAGDFDKAVATAQKAISLADAAGQPDLAEDFKSRLQLYQSGKPFYESSPEK